MQQTVPAVLFDHSTILFIMLLLVRLLCKLRIVGLVR